MKSSDCAAPAASAAVLKFHKGQEFTKKACPGAHCIVHDFYPDELSYLVEYTASGNLKKIPQAVLLQHYALSDRGQQQAAIEAMGKTRRDTTWPAEDGGWVGCARTQTTALASPSYGASHEH